MISSSNVLFTFSPEDVSALLLIPLTKHPETGPDQHTEALHMNINANVKTVTLAENVHDDL